MLEILKWIFSSFWIFVGVCCLIYVIGEVIVAILTAAWGHVSYTRRTTYKEDP